MIKCNGCGADIEQGEEREHLGRVLCDDCYIDARSPLRTCDPWAVHSAKSLENAMPGSTTLTETQFEILRIIKEAGEIEPVTLQERLGNKLTMPQIEREFATLRHMEKARATRKNGRIYLILW